MSSADPDNLTGGYDEIGILEEKYNDMIFRINDMIENQYRSDITIKDAHLQSGI